MLLRTLLVLLAAAPAIWAAPGITQDEFRERRSKVRAQLAKDAGLLVLYGSTEDERGDLRGRFFQEPNFYYLSGWSEPGAVLLLTAEEEFLFLPARNETKERYTGRKLVAEDVDARVATGFATVLPLPKFELTFFQKVENAKKLYSLVVPGKGTRLRRLAGTRPIENGTGLIYPLRMKKSPAELALLQKSVDVTVEAHLAAWRRTASGLFEYQISSTMTNVYFEAGCERSAYPPIVGSGPNSTILHYNQNTRRMDSGEVLLMDMGGECGMYASDITRTVPVNGKFSARQKEIYDVVLGAQQAAIAAVKPGALLSKTAEGSLYKIAEEYMNEHGRSLKGEPLGKYFTHGLGHHVGLEVHDPGMPNLPLEAGNVITIEPGIYIPEEGIGIRIEDMVLVTATGGKLLSGALPREPGAIEKLLHARRP